MTIFLMIFRSSLLFLLLVQPVYALDLVMGLNHSARPLDTLNDDRLNAVIGLSQRFEIKDDVSIDIYGMHESRISSSDLHHGRNKIGFNFVIHLNSKRLY